MSIKPVSPVSVAQVASQMRMGLDIFNKQGHDGQDVALGTLSALRSFVLASVGPEKYMLAIADLAEWLQKGE